MLDHYESRRLVWRRLWADVGKLIIFGAIVIALSRQAAQSEREIERLKQRVEVLENNAVSDRQDIQRMGFALSKRMEEDRDKP